MLRQVKPRNARSKRALERREAKAVENPKQCLFLRGSSCSQVVQDALSDLHSLRLPLAKKFTKKNPIHPFEDATSLEFFSEKNDASLLVFGSSQKKRPHAVTLIRTFGYKVLDMLELYLDPETFRTMAQFKNKKFAIGLRPMLLFAGTAFESPVSDEYTLAKSLLIDFFRGDPSDKIDVEGLQYIVSVTAEDAAGDGEAKPAIHLRAYMIRTRRSGQKLPRVEVEEIGPRMDFRVGRVKEPDESMLKEAMKKARGLEERTKKNITTDSMGDKIGRVHLGKQDLSQLQLRKMKGLKRSRDDGEELVQDVIADVDTKRTKN
ncbi:Brix domain-containing protein-like protein [Metarhizium album ARSEF 1941]|uniref:Ribosome production factor 2 homolog n=1 Tax=Metarhizium album (strain ARSEF 1941) TaxID=1081103 RepID=A0A0B2WL81_METAS|nr:Brix domain-containing protein-like protein [Metarhizium album ARSEF 1941]KHN94454.1 Brix domain-containing protein-like protein [Metarhizium album ARSEF 1941]